MKALVLMLLSVLPRPDVAEDRCDVLLYEHFYDGDGRKVFTQLCPLDWNAEESRYDYVCFRLEKQCGSLRPQRDWLRGGYSVTFADGELLRVVRAHAMREDWTQTDSELTAREVLPKERRRGLITHTRSGPDAVTPGPNHVP